MKSDNSETGQGDKLPVLSRRKALKFISSLSVGAAVPIQLQAKENSTKGFSTSSKKLKKIATEEAWCIPEISDMLRSMVKKGSTNLDYKLIAQIYDAPVVQSTPKDTGVNQTANRDSSAGLMLPKLLDTEKIRNRGHEYKWSGYAFVVPCSSWSTDF